MRASIIISVLALVLTTQCFANEKRILQKDITRELAGMWLTRGKMTFLGHQCNLTLVPKFSFWNLYYDGTFTCPQWTDIEGNSKRRCKIDAVLKAMEQFLRKGIAKGLFKYREATDWLNDMRNKSRLLPVYR
ncbi:anti-lipopolysaccharide factor-like isoform X2 [Penaeus japonicus]|uniref:anti-lipopolysaccharide factor-like isoform X2 n=1 Tax=Penaeus japonicus TaxID=27405 RepID=UPI001C715CB9|nr:anti-lipopolysaccharide factor-like isoform X2 [Penaeus japonicus]